MAAETTTVATAQQKRPKRLIRLIACGVVVWAIVAYIVLPLLWHRYEKRHPALADAPDVTHTISGIPGDPLNVALIGTEEFVHKAMIAAKWYPADKITLASSLRIATGVVFDRPYADAPVSSLYLWGRKEDLAFEQPVGNDPKRRHHVRFWRAEKLDEQGRPLWLGAATFDTHVGLSYTTAEVTHHIAADVDADRDKVMNDIRNAGDLAAEYWIDGFHKVLQGKNGGGDPWHTDGRLAIGLLQLK